MQRLGLERAEVLEVGEERQRDLRADVGDLQFAVETSADWFRNLLDDMVQCADEYARLCELLAEKCGVDDSGYSLAPPSSNSLRLTEFMMAMTERTMNGSVKMTCPTSMKAQLLRNSVKPP